MGSVAHNPSADWRNLGWALAGAFTTVYQAISSLNDTDFIKCPGSKSDAAVTFPLDITSIPDGAIITSVTLKARIGTGAGSPPAGQSPSITFSIASKDDTSKFTVRTVFATNTPTDIEIATYNRDAIGQLWDIFRLNQLICRVFSYVGIFDLVRCYRLWCDIKYRVRPVVTVSAPSGTVLTPSPIITWTYTQSDGDPCQKTEYKIFTAEQTTAVSFNPETDSPIYSTTVQGDVTSVTLPTSLNPNTYKVYVRSYSTFGAKSVWVNRQFTVVGQSPGTPGVVDPTGSVPAGTGVIDVVPDSITGSATLRMQDTSNLLSAQEADAETAADGVTFLSAINCTLTRDPAVGFPGGSASFKMAVTAATGDMAYLSDFTEVSPGYEMTARAQFLTAVTGRLCRVKILWYDSSFGLLSNSTGTDITDATSTWREATVVATSPVDAAYAKVVASVDAGAVAEVHWVDHVGLMYGDNTPWSDGGHTSRNLLSMWYSSSEGTQGTDGWTAESATTWANQASPGGTGASGTNCNKLTYVGISPSIAFVAAGTAFNSATSGANFTLNKPAGVASGHLMLAFVTAGEYTTITPPAGWTLVNSARVDDGSTDTSMFVLKRTAGGSEPSSWTDGTIGTNSARRTAVVVAYSGAADASEQFLAEAQVSSGDATPPFLTVPAVNNSDPNAWRISAFAVSDDFATGTLTANKQAPSIVPAIEFVGVGTAWGSSSTGTGFTINKPSGVQSGDLMVAVFGSVALNTTINPPSGWTLEYTNSINSNGGPSTIAVMYRIAGGSEPSSWSGTFTGGSRYGRTVVESFAYRNVDSSDPFLVSNGNVQANAGFSMSVGSVTNSNSNAWRFTAFAGLSTNPNDWTSNEVIQRDDRYWQNGSGTMSVATFDSNGPVSAATYTRTGTATQSQYATAAFLGFLRPLPSAPTPPGGETSRAVAEVGSANPWLETRVFDSGAPIAVGSQSVTGIWDQADKHSMAGWQGIIKPAAAVVGGYAAAKMTTPVDVSLISNEVDKSKVTVSASFLGSTGGGGTPYLTVEFYRANVLLATSVAQGTVFNTTVWTKSVALFDVPAGTTHMKVKISVSDRAVNDVVYWDRTMLAFGDYPVYRPGTSRQAHPVYSQPILEYADDDGTGYGDWLPLPGTSANPPVFEPLTGLTTYIDHTVVPLLNRKYRARTRSFGLLGDQFVSNWGPDSSEFSFVAENWWLKDIEDLDANIELHVKWDNQATTTSNTATAFQPIGRDRPVVLTEGYKGDVLPLVLIPVNRGDYARLKRMLKSGKTLFLQSDVDLAWWVRPVGDLQADVLPTGDRKANPLREIKVTFTEVDIPE
ncbi:minor tail protein [Rhodococcus phage Shagrat]|nr:minor tail protein [Rhodococcus phage Shagrat]